MTIVEATTDATLFGPFFGAKSWAPWRVFLASVFGLPLPRQGRGLYRECTGREMAPTTPVREAWCVAGRRSGKSFVSALVACYLASFREYRRMPGETLVIPIIAVDRRQAKVVFDYVVGLLTSVPMLARSIVNQTADTVTLATGVRIEVRTANFRSQRGMACPAAILDECAFYRDETSAAPDVELVRALKPALASVPGSVLVGISSPYARRGVLWNQFRHHFGKDSPVLIWRAPSVTMNPTLDAGTVAEAMEADPEAARSEYGGEFRSDLEPFLAQPMLDAVVVPGRYELPPVAGVSYRAFLDPSGGSQDSFTCAVAHHDGERVVLDCLREKRPPFSPDAVVAEYAAVLKSYGCTHAVADKYAGQWVVEAFAKEGVAVEQSAAPKSELYLGLLPLVTGGKVALLDHPKLVTQLVSLERRTTRAGKDSVDHPPGAHDDCANAAAGALTLASVPCAGFVTARGLAKERQRYNISGEMTYEREMWEEEREEWRRW